MTAPFEIEEPEPVYVPLPAGAGPIEGTSFVRTPCVDGECDVLVVCVPGREKEARCMTHARLVAGVDWESSVPLRVDAAGRRDLSGLRIHRRYPYVPPRDPAPENRSELVPPEMVCPPFGSTPEGGLLVGSNGCHEAPGPVEDLAMEAWGLGWQVLTQHSRARNMQANGKQGAKVEDFWGVRFRRGEWAGYAVRRGDAWDGVCVTGSVLPPFLALGVTDLRVWLAEPERPASWYQEIRERVKARDLASKQRACPGPGLCAWVDEGRGDHTHRANGDIKIKKTRKEQVSGA